MKHVFLTLHIQCGEYEFFNTSVHVIKAKDISKWADKYASNFYGTKGEKEDNTGAYYFNAGEVAVEVNSIQQISEEEYNTLIKFL